MSSPFAGRKIGKYTIKQQIGGGMSLVFKATDSENGRDVALKLVHLASADGVTVKELAKRLAMHETTLIRTLRILERQGWVALKVGDDRRQRIASLTRAGRAVFGKALKGWKSAQSEVAALLDEQVPETNRRLVRLARSVWRA